MNRLPWQLHWQRLHRRGCETNRPWFILIEKEAEYLEACRSCIEGIAVTSPQADADCISTSARGLDT
ncbi:MULTISPECIES: hypothetical protein [Bacillales]|uniref:hypothetical protein n=1 Tax=Bacillales TaxID=1385 RepID=UPI000B0C0A6B|nr:MULTISPECIES: hypothetical protein [Bacillales]